MRTIELTVPIGRVMLTMQCTLAPLPESSPADVEQAFAQLRQALREGYPNALHMREFPQPEQSDE